MSTSLRVEFHCHSIYSKDSLTEPAALVAACRRKGIDRVIITDHNSIGGARQAHALDPQRVIVGEEIMTTGGEILAAFVKEEIPPGLSPQETIERLRQQGAFISVSHPFDLTRKGHWEPETLQAIAPLVDAIEVFNSRCINDIPNQQAQAFAEQHHLPGTVGSDAHTTIELGRSVLLLPEFSDAEGLKQAIRSARREVRLSTPLIHLNSRWAALVKRIKSI